MSEPASIQGVFIRPVQAADVQVIHDFILKLAEFEQAADMVKMTREQLYDALFSEKPRAEALVLDSPSGEHGFAIWYESFNTWTGRPALQIEDIFINESARGQGLGLMVYRFLANIAVLRGCHRMEWATLNWNNPAVAFYESIGAKNMSDWTRYRLSGPELAAFAASKKQHG